MNLSLYRRKHLALLRVAAVLLVLALALPVNAHAAAPSSIQPLSSNYILTYSAEVVAMGNAQVQVQFYIKGLGIVPKLGAATITLYQSIDSQNWFLAETYSYQTTSGLMSYSSTYHEGYVSHDGYPGRFYKATVTFYGGTTSTGDTYDYNTSTILST